MSRFDVVTFVTDYGSAGGFVGALHAVVDALGPPGVRIIDLDHHIPRHDVLLGALRLEGAMAYVRPGIHVAVVDPGVGTTRRAVAVETAERVFIGPDNGVLGFAIAAAGGSTRAVELTAVARPDAASTFDGRDVFAPAAGRLAAGADLGELGPDLDPAGLQVLERPGLRAEGDGRFIAMVVQVDGFGNVQLGAEGAILTRLGTSAILSRQEGRSRLLLPVRSTFGDVAEGEALLLSDSDGRVAISVNRGRADELLDHLRPGDVVVLEPG